MSEDYPVEPILPAYYLHLVPETGSEFNLEVRREDELLYDERISRGDWRSGQNRSRIAARVSRGIPIPENHHEEGVKRRVERALERISSYESENEEQFAEETRTDEVRDLIEQTERVVVYPEEEDAEWIAELTPPEESPKEVPQKLSFTAGQLHNQNPGAFMTKYLGAFLTRVELDSVAWADYRDHLIDSAEPEAAEVDSRKEAIIETLIQQINSRVWDVVDKDDAEEQFKSEPEARVAIYHENWDGTDDDAVLVPNTWVDQFLQEYSANDLDLSKELRDREILLDTTTEIVVGGTQTRVWPLAAEETDYAGKENLWTSTKDEEPSGIDL